MYSLHCTLTFRAKLERPSERLLAYERLLREPRRILPAMFQARGSKTAWLLRIAAFVLFISGGALAQRYLTAPNVIRALPLEQQQKEQPSAVIFEAMRKVEFAPAFADAVPPLVTPFAPRLEALFKPMLGSRSSSTVTCGRRPPVASHVTSRRNGNGRPRP